MSDKVTLTVHYVDGSRSVFSFDRQAEAAVAGTLLERLSDGQVLTIETDEGLITIPWSSIKYLHSYPNPKALPKTAIRGARILE
ncbi:MAG TPA: hypothetical protein VIM96_04890 [Pseudomonadales bacterium]|jgi:hypothetical protein